MAIVGAFDIHRRQLTYDYIDVESGEVNRGRVMPADREHLRAFLGRFPDSQDVAFAMEGCTGWRYVVEELQAAGIRAHVADWGSRFDGPWFRRLGVYTLTGTVRYGTAHA